MNFLKKLILVTTISIFIFSCEDDISNETSLAVVCTGVFNDENGNELAEEGETITYTFMVKNTGDIRLSNIRINDERLHIQNALIEQFSLVPGATVSKSFNYTLTQSDIMTDNITNQATVTGVNSSGETFSDLSDQSSYEMDNNTIITFTPFLGNYEAGFFIVNQGGYGNGNASITHIDEDGTVTQNIYHDVNNENLGDIAQTMTFHANKAYIVVNNSHKVVVVNRYTMEKLTVIEGDAINNPRDFVVVGNKGYVSNWGDASNPSDDFIAVINLDDSTVLSTISVGEGPETMLAVDTKIYVNLQGGYSQNNKVEVIDSTTDTVSSTITVGDVPTSILKDTDGSIWVLCAGKPNYTGAESAGSLVKIINDTVDSTISFGTTEHPKFLNLHGTNLLYHLNGGVYSIENTATELSTTAIEGLNGSYFAMKTHGDKLYTSDAGNYTSEGTFKIFNLNDNTEASTGTTGIIPGSFIFQ